jgi:hypothetical protein
MPARVAEDFDEEVRTTVDHLGLFFEVGRAIDHTEDFNDASDAVQIPKRCFGRSEDL